MKKETEISLAASGAMGSKYDEACKQLFQNREIIAPILKYVVPEYQDSTRGGDHPLYRCGQYRGCSGG